MVDLWWHVDYRFLINNYGTQDTDLDLKSNSNFAKIKIVSDSAETVLSHGCRISTFTKCRNRTFAKCFERSFRWSSVTRSADLKLWKTARTHTQLCKRKF